MARRLIGSGAADLLGCGNLRIRGREDQVTRLTLLVLVAAVAGGCSADPTDSEEYAALEAELADTREELETLQAALDEMAIERDSAVDEVAHLSGDLDASRDALEQAEETADELRLRYDDEIRGDLQAEYDELVQKQCAAAGEAPTRSVASLVTFDEKFEVLGLSKEQMVEAVTDCAAPARAEASLSQEEAVAALEATATSIVEAYRTRFSDGQAATESAAADAAEVLDGAVVQPSSWVTALRELAAYECQFDCNQFDTRDVMGLLQQVGVDAPDVLLDGTRTVDDSLVGTWTAYHPGDCYWARLDERGETIDNNFTSAPQVQVTIRSTDFGFESDGCRLWFKP